MGSKKDTGTWLQGGESEPGLSLWDCGVQKPWRGISRFSFGAELLFGAGDWFSFADGNEIFHKDKDWQKGPGRI